MTTCTASSQSAAAAIDLEKSELQSLIRVRNRLATSPDEKLPQILGKLLPRLLQRFDRTNTAYFSLERTSSTTTTSQHDLLEQQIRHYTGIFSHVLDRIRLVQTGEFCETVLPTLSAFKSSTTITMALSLLQAGLPYFHQKHHELDLSPLMTLVHETHQALHANGALLSYQNQNQNRTNNSTAVVLSSVAQIHYRMSGWLLLEAMALTFGLLPVLLVREDGEDNNKSTVSWDELHHQSLKKQPLNLRLDGVFHLVLDLLLFWPMPPAPTTTTRFPGHEVVVVVPDNSTGLSAEALARLNNNSNNNRSKYMTWNEVHLRQLKFVTLKYALATPSQVTDVVATNVVADDDDDAVVSERKRILAVLFASTHSMHGRLATNYLNNQLTTSGDSLHCSLSLATSLLILVLGDQAASTVLVESHDTERRLWEPILGVQLSNNADERLLRAPLPLHFAVRAVTFVRQHLLLSNTHPSLLVQQSQIQVVADLAVAIQNMERNGVYWGIRLMYKLYHEIQSFTSCGGGGGTGDEDWTLDFYQKCLATCKSVLSMVPDHHGESRSTVPQRQQADDLMEHLLGVLERFGRRRDLDTLVNNHRKMQRNRLLQGNDAVSARKVAYDMIAKLTRQQASHNESSKPDLDLCTTVFKWVPFEDESNQASLSKALETFLVAYQTVGNGEESGFKERTVSTFIPFLLVAACSDSSNARLVALQWSSRLVAPVEPEVAAHICSFLSKDTHDLVAKQAKCAMRKLERPSASPSHAAVCDTVFYDVRLPEDRFAIVNNLKSLLQPLQCEFGLEASSALAILSDHKYSVQAAKQSLRDDRSGALTASGLGFRCGVKVPMEMDTEAARSCEICYDDVLDSSAAYALPCKHDFCRSCWAAFLEDRLVTRMTADRVCCPRHDCDERVLMCDIAKIREELVPPWYDIQLISFVDKCDSYSRCTGPDCPMVAQRLKPSSKPASCPHCATSFCFGCRQKPHMPAACHHFEQWHRIYSSSKFWIQKNTKPCPTCKVPIEKNEGCNHMDCSLCGAAFCWLCLSPLRRHMEAHSCNAYDPLQSAGNDDERRALFFTERFTAHEEAETFCRNRLKHYDEDGDSVAERLWYLSVEQLNSLYDVTEALAEARSFLQYSYVAAWAMQSDSPHDSRFTQLQATLENVTERLSYMSFQNLESVFRDEGPGGLKSHFKTMEFLVEAMKMFMNRMLLLGSEPKRSLS